MRQTGKSNRVNKATECTHTSDRAGKPVRGQRAAKGEPRSAGHGDSGEVIPGSKSEYMKAYYARNKDKWANRRRENRDAINAAKRASYAANPDIQEYYKRHAKQYRIDNPNRRRHGEIRKRYGLTPEQYQLMRDAQNDSCAVCRKKFSKTPHVDHCHDGGHVRGLLCFNCNRAIGHFQNDVTIIQNAIRYLKRN